MKILLLLALQALLVLLLADLAAGFIHWAEDAYIREDTLLLGNWVARPNIIHHHLPRHFTHLSWWESSRDLLCISAALVAGAWALGALTWHVWLFTAISTNANQIHKWAHRTRRENGRLVSFLQDIRLLQTPQHHAIHHTNPKDTYYCPVTNLLNPALEKLRFWEGIEWLIAKTVGLQRREDTSLPGHGPAPEWLAQLRPHSSNR